MSSISLESLLQTESELGFEGLFEMEDFDPDMDPAIYDFEGLDALRESDVDGAVIDSALSTVALLEKIKTQYSLENLESDLGFEASKFVENAKTAIVTAFKRLVTFFANLIKRFTIWISNFKSDSATKLIREYKAEDINAEAEAALPPKVKSVAGVVAIGKEAAAEAVKAIDLAKSAKAPEGAKKEAVNTASVVRDALYEGKFAVTKQKVKDWLDGSVVSAVSTLDSKGIKDLVNQAKETQKAAAAASNEAAKADKSVGGNVWAAARLATSRAAAVQYQSIIELIRLRSFVVRAIKAGSKGAKKEGDK